MKKFKKLLGLFSLFILGGAVAFGSLAFAKQSVKQEANAATSRGYFFGESGQTVYVAGFDGNGADLAIYFYNSKGSAWSTKTHHSFDGKYFVQAPKLGDSSTIWTFLIATRYNPSLDPSVNKWDGVYNQTNDINISNYFGNGQYNKNVLSITGYSGSTLTTTEQANTYSEHPGISSGTHLYLDLVDLQDWLQGGAKFAFYFAYPNTGSGEAWAFCHKTNGQDNEYLYDCVVPQLNGTANVIWNMIIATRYNPDTEGYGWDKVWNKTQDLTFTMSSNAYNLVRPTKNGEDWSGGGYIYATTISNDSRAEFYAQYFLDTVKCSGTGASDSTTAAMWTAVKEDYENCLSTTVQGLVWKASGDPEGSILEQAMARYDYIVFYKQYEHADFMNREESPGKSYLSSVPAVTNNDVTNNSAFLITVISILAVSSLSVIGILVIKNHKKKY